MKKYAPLEKYLESKGFDSVPMTFSEIESIIGDQLPPSARAHRAWWSNNPTNSVITYAWLAAGYKTTNVNLEGEKVVFRKQDTAARAARGGEAARRTGPKRHPVFGCMKGSVTFSVDVDLTTPAAPEWAQQAEELDLDNG